MVTRETAAGQWRTAAVVSCAVITAVFFYAAVIEAVRRLVPSAPPLTGTAAAAARYSLYFAGAAAVALVSPVGRAIEARRWAAGAGPAPEAALKALNARAMAAAVLCEVPALAGFVIFFLAGGYWDFYLLALFSLVMQFRYFPRRREWEEAAGSAQ